MTQNDLNIKDVASIGEEIGLELGIQFIKSHKSDVGQSQSYLIGKDILLRILSQPNCKGIKIYDAKDESGNTTLVFVGVDSSAKPIIEYSVISSEGQLKEEAGIVADRIYKPKSTSLEEDWGWGID